MMIHRVYHFFARLLEKNENNNDNALIAVKPAIQESSSTNEIVLSNSTCYSNSNEGKNRTKNCINEQHSEDLLSSNKIEWSSFRILSPNSMLTDNEIFASLKILKNQFSHKSYLKGFFDPQVWF
jgi:hypothetical protein